MLVRAQTKLPRIKVSPFEWSHHLFITDYAGHVGLDEKKIEFIHKVCEIAFKFERYFSYLKGPDFSGKEVKLVIWK